METHRIPSKLIFNYILKVLAVVGLAPPVLYFLFVGTPNTQSLTILSIAGVLLSGLFMYVAYMLIMEIYRYNCDVFEIKSLVSVLFLLLIVLIAHILLVFWFDGTGFQPAVIPFVLPHALVGLGGIWSFRLPENI